MNALEQNAINRGEIFFKKLEISSFYLINELEEK